LKKTVLTFGLISGVIVAVLMGVNTFFADQIGFDRAIFAGYAAMLVAFLLVFFGIKSYRDNVGNGEITFGRAFTVGILITLITCVFYVAIWEVLYYTVLHDFPEKYGNYVMEKARASGATAEQLAEQLEEVKKMKALLDNPLVAPALIFISEPLPVGLVMTLISAAILRKRRKQVEVPV
jgi:amino acid transporter